MTTRVWTWVRRIAIVLAILVLALLLLAAVAQQWIMPRVLRGQIVAGLSKHWEGRVTVRAVRFSFFGPTQIDGLRMEDTHGRTWVDVDNATANLRDWPSFSPVLDELDLDEVTVQIRVGADFPLIQPEDEQDPSPYINLERIRVRHLILILHHEDELLDLGRLQLSVDIENDTYRFQLAPLPGSDGRLNASGTIAGAPAEIRARIRFDRQIGRDDMAFLQTFVDGELPIRRAEGWLTAWANVRGPLEHWSRLDISGQAALESWNFRTASNLPVSNLEAQIDFQDWQFRAHQVSLTVLDNPVTAGATVSVGTEALSFQGWVRADRIDLGNLGAALDVPQLRHGHAGFLVNLNGPVAGRIEFEGLANIQAGLDAGPLAFAGGPVAFAGSVPIAAAAEDDLIRGQVELRDWQLMDDDGPFVRRLAATIQMDGNVLSMPHATADALGGRLTMSGRVALPAEGPAGAIGFGGRMLAQGLQIEHLSTLLGISTDATGTADLDAEWSIRSGPTWLITAIGGGAVRISADGDNHLVQGHLSLRTEPAADEFAVTLRLRDWDWWRNDRLLAALSDAALEISEHRVAADRMVVLTPGGNVQASGELWRRHSDEPWRYEGDFALTNFDPLLFATDATDGLAHLLVTMRGRFSGLGDQWLQGIAGGVVTAIWPEPYAARVTSNLMIDLGLESFAERDALDRMRLIVNLDDGAVDHRGELVFSGLWAEATVRRGGVDALFRGRGVGGEFIGQAGSAVRDGGTYFWGDLTLSQLDLARLPMIIAAPPWLLGTRLDSRIWLETQPDDVLAMRGSGSISGGLAFEELSAVSGDYEFDLKMDDFAAPGGPRVTGTAGFSNGELRNPQSVLVENLRMSAIAFGRSADVSSIRGTILGGRSHGMFRMDYPADAPMSFRGGINISRLDLKTAALAFGHTGEDVSGNADLQYRFAGTEFAPEAISGNGALLVRESEMVGVPVLQAVLAALILAPESASNTDLDLSFSNQGPMVTLLGGRAATPVVAIRPLPGGTINLETGELDFTVVAALMRDLEQLTDVPLLDLLVPLLGRLTQIHVTGTWEDRDSIQTRSAPVSGVTGATAEFFRGIGRTGGELGEALFSPLRQPGP